MKRATIGTIVGGSIAILAIVTVLNKCGAFIGPLVHELPPHYRGWVVIQYEDSHCPPLAHTGSFPNVGTIISIPSSGCVCTSTPPSYEERWYRYEYVFPDGHRGPLASFGGIPNGAVPDVYIWQESGVGIKTTKSGHTRLPRTEFFVGTREEYAALGRGDAYEPFSTSDEKQCPDLDGLLGR